MATADCHHRFAPLVPNDASLRKIRVVLLLHVGERQAELRAVGPSTFVCPSRRGIRRLAETDQVEEVLPFEEELAPPRSEKRRVGKEWRLRGSAEHGVEKRG